MRKLCRRVIYPAIFILIFTFLVQRIAWVVQAYGTEEGDPDRRNCLFFTLPQNTVDCLFLGTSHVYCSYIPKNIYDETGISSASVATSSQSYQNSYWVLKEVFQYQSPKVVVLDIHSITTAVDEQVQNFRLHYSSGISIIPDISLTKLSAYRDIKNIHYGWSDQMTVYDAYALIEYKSEYNRQHQSLQELGNLLFDPANEYSTFGYYPATTVYPIERLQASVTSDQYVNLYDTVEFQYLEKIYELIRQKDAELLLTRAPYTTELDDHQLYQQVFAWAEQEKIPIIDYFDLIEQLRINLDMDFRDADHLNYLGAEKATEYMADYLQTNYAFTDHRGDKKYKLWEENTFDYEEIRQEVIYNYEKNK